MIGDGYQISKLFKFIVHYNRRVILYDIKRYFKTFQVYSSYLYKKLKKGEYNNFKTFQVYSSFRIYNNNEFSCL